MERGVRMISVLFGSLRLRLKERSNEYLHYFFLLKLFFFCRIKSFNIGGLWQ